MATKTSSLYDPEKKIAFGPLAGDAEASKLLAGQFTHLLDGKHGLTFPVELDDGTVAVFDVKEKRDGSGFVATMDSGLDSGWGKATVRREGTGWMLLPGYAAGSRDERLRDEALSLVWNLHRSQVPADARWRS